MRCLKLLPHETDHSHRPWRPRRRSRIDGDGSSKILLWRSACPPYKTPVLGTTDGAPVVLVARPNSEADRLARRLMAREIERSRTNGEDPLVLVGMARLNDADEVLFVQLQSPGECGSAGCSTVSFRYVDSRWVRIMGTVSGTVRIATSRHRGMAELILQDGNHMVWDGMKYGDIG